MSENIFESEEETNPQPDRAPPRESDGPSGLGGWLVLVAIGLIFTVLRLTATVITTHLPIFSGGQWEVLTTPGTEAYHPMWAPLLLGEIFGNLFFAALAAFLLILFFLKSHWFPRVFIAYMFANVAFVVGDAVLGNAIPAVAAMADADTIKEVMRSVVATSVWVPYMLVSKRVKNTFVNPARVID